MAEEVKIVIDLIECFSESKGSQRMPIYCIYLSS